MHSVNIEGLKEAEDQSRKHQFSFPFPALNFFLEYLLIHLHFQHLFSNYCKYKKGIILKVVKDTKINKL